MNFNILLSVVVPCRKVLFL